MTIEFNVSADSVSEAKAKAQKLADPLNSRDPEHKAWVKRMERNISENKGGRPLKHTVLWYAPDPD